MRHGELKALRPARRPAGRVGGELKPRRRPGAARGEARPRWRVGRGVGIGARQVWPRVAVGPVIDVREERGRAGEKGGLRLSVRRELQILADAGVVLPLYLESSIISVHRVRG